MPYETFRVQLIYTYDNIFVKTSDVGGWFLSHFILHFKNEFCNVSPPVLMSREDEKSLLF